MNTSKWIGTSVTFWGIVISVAATVSPFLSQLVGINVSPSDVQEIGTQGTQWLQATGALIGAIIALYGRVHASQKVVLLRKNLT